MQKEVWKDIPEYEGLYQVSNLGNVMSLSRDKLSRNRNGFFKFTTKEKLLKLFIDDKGYYMVKLYNKSIKKTLKVHKLVAITFLNHKPNGYVLVIDHIDNNKTNNKLENLQIITQRENASKDRKGTSKYTGVSWNKIHNKWESYITINKKRKFLGYYVNELEASEVYKNKVNELKKINNEK